MAGRKTEPAKYWLSNLPPDTPLRDLVCLAKLRWRIEQDYRRTQRRDGPGSLRRALLARLHHHVTLVSVAPGFLTTERLRPPPTRAAPDLAQRDGPGATSGPGLLAGHLPHLPRTAGARSTTPPSTMT